MTKVLQKIFKLKMKKNYMISKKIHLYSLILCFSIFHNNSFYFLSFKTICGINLHWNMTVSLKFSFLSDIFKNIKKININWL